MFVIVKQIWTGNAYRNLNYLFASGEARIIPCLSVEVLFGQQAGRRTAESRNEEQDMKTA